MTKINEKAKGTKAKGTKAKGTKAKGTKAKGEADKARECTFPRAIIIAAINADGTAEDAALAMLRAGIKDRLTPAALMDAARECKRPMPLASAKVRASEVNSAGKVASIYGAALAGEIIAAGCKLPGHRVRNGLMALRVAKEAAKDAGETFPAGTPARRRFFADAWKAAQAAADALKAKRAAALAAGKGAKAGDGDGDGDGDGATGAEGNRFPDSAKVTTIEEGRARLVTLAATAAAMNDQLAKLPAAAFANKKARAAVLVAVSMLGDCLRDALPPQ
jgi:hypothetical protein